MLPRKKRLPRYFFLLIALSFSFDHFALAQEVAKEDILGLIEQAQEARSQSDYVKGNALAERAVNLSETLNDDLLYCKSYYEWAVQAFRLSQFSVARSRAEVGLAKSRFCEFRLLEADFLQLIGGLEKRLGNVSEAKEYLVSALEIAKEEKASIKKTYIANHLGICFAAEQDFANAIKHYQLAEKWLGDLEDDSIRAAIYSNHAETLIKTGDLEMAEKLLQKSLALELTLKNPLNIAYTYFNFGELYSKMKRNDESKDYLHRALNLQKQTAADYPVAITTLKLAENAIEQGLNKEAVNLLDESFLSVKRMNGAELLRDYAAMYSRAYENLEDEGLATYYRNIQSHYQNEFKPEESGSPKKRPITPLSHQAEISTPSFNNFQIASFVLLGILIGVLFAEIWRTGRRKSTTRKS